MKHWIRKGEWMELPAPHEDWKPLAPGAIDALSVLIPVPRKLFLRLASQGAVKVQGSSILIKLFPEEKTGIEPEYQEIEILYEDDFCLVVNKPAGMSIHPSEHGQKGSLAAAVAHYYASSGQAHAIRHIHRLDKETTGAVLYAKNEWAHVLLDEAMREKRIDRRYVAVAQGVLRARQGTIKQPIGKDRHHSGKRRVSPGGDDAVTHYKVLEALKNATMVGLRLETGRTHQIRVHLSYMGHPLAGDTLYGGSSALFHRQALHGEQLLFEHPVTLEKLDIHAPLPKDLQLFIEKLRRT
ncbi:RluA family pseudouridine synthase [Paenibacillus hexagrammi]|uniref:Pseudouridine synthase n=1 Tax=Paenibacillus hexagrammi TaxID=2908839 RepID=A0ABY3SDE9_9BACL|nr:RluA family pseudouridine synthase [Paenibacillus sp. YPD9-1]UJF32014.1 RluA family pseudouridine synthase [Paenibacillus sp. YPD9-1]